MKKNILITILLIFIFTIHNAFAEDKADEFTVRLPDGLYLYQPKITEEVFSPLFIVENGALVDPYALASEMGKEKFLIDYVEGNVFNVYIGGDIVGKFSKARAEFLNDCELGSLPDIRFKGSYEGKSLKEINLDKSLFAAKWPDRTYGATKAIAAPASLKTIKTESYFKINQDDRKRASAVAKHKIAPELFKNTKVAMGYLYDKQIITGSDERLGFIKAFDIDGNGKKDFIGSYILQIYHKDDEVDGTSYRGFRGESLFTISDNGNIQNVFASYEVRPGLSLGGVIDINQDGVYELVVQENDGNYESGIDNVRRIEVMVLKDASAWKSIYLTDTICGLNF